MLDLLEVQSPAGQMLFSVHPARFVSRGRHKLSAFKGNWKSLEQCPPGSNLPHENNGGRSRAVSSRVSDAQLAPASSGLFFLEVGPFHRSHHCIRCNGKDAKHDQGVAESYHQIGSQSSQQSEIPRARKQRQSDHRHGKSDGDYKMVELHSDRY